MPTHGQRSAYVRGCRCCPCRSANAAYIRAYRAKTGPSLHTTVPAYRVHLMMRSLRAEMSIAEFERRLGLKRNYWRMKARSRVTLRTAIKVRRLFRALMDADGEESLTSTQRERSRQILESLGRA